MAHSQWTNNYNVNTPVTNLGGGTSDPHSLTTTNEKHLLRTGVTIAENSASGSEWI
jgi:hypothetical protein